MRQQKKYQVFLLLFFVFRTDFQPSRKYDNSRSYELRNYHIALEKQLHLYLQEHFLWFVIYSLVIFQLYTIITLQQNNRINIKTYINRTSFLFVKLINIWKQLKLCLLNSIKNC